MDVDEAMGRARSRSAWARYEWWVVEIQPGDFTACSAVDAPEIGVSPSDPRVFAAYRRGNQVDTPSGSPPARRAAGGSGPGGGAPRGTGATDNREVYAGTGDGEWRPPAEVYDLLSDEARRVLAEGDREMRLAFLERYERRRKRSWLAYLLWFFFGWHLAYLGRWMLQAAFSLTFGGLSIWWFVDLFRMQGLIARANARVADEALQYAAALTHA